MNTLKRKGILLIFDGLGDAPVPVLGKFDEAFLELPREVVVSTLTGHQRYFPVADDNGNLLQRIVEAAPLPDAGAADAATTDGGATDDAAASQDGGEQLDGAVYPPPEALAATRAVTDSFRVGLVAPHLGQSSSSSSANRTWRESSSASEWTATV